MKKQMMGGLVGVLTLGLAACGGTPTPAGGERTDGSHTLRYVQDGQVLSAEAVQGLEAQHGRLFYLVGGDTSGDTSGPVAQVFTREADFERAKGEVQAQALCVSTRSKTTVYDFENYGSDHLDISKGTSISNLGSLVQSDGESWYEDISSFRGADCVYTYLYMGTNFTGSVWASKGSNFAVMGGWNNKVRSIKVGS